MSIENMSLNTKLEVALEILAAQIAKTSKQGFTADDVKMQNLLKERDILYSGDEEILNKIIEEYGPEMKKNYEDIALIDRELNRQ